MCVAACRSVMQCVAVCCSVLQCVVVCCSGFSCVAVCCRVLQCVSIHMFAARNKEECIAWTRVHIAGCCSVSLFIYSLPAMKKRVLLGLRCVLQCVAVCCSGLQCVAVGCSVLQCVGIHMFSDRNEEVCIAWTEVCVCVRERERNRAAKRQRETDADIDRDRQIDRQTDGQTDR